MSHNASRSGHFKTKMRHYLRVFFVLFHLKEKAAPSEEAADNDYFGNHYYDTFRIFATVSVLQLSAEIILP